MMPPRRPAFDLAGGYANTLFTILGFIYQAENLAAAFHIIRMTSFHLVVIENNCVHLNNLGLLMDISPYTSVVVRTPATDAAKTQIVPLPKRFDRTTAQNVREEILNHLHTANAMGEAPHLFIDGKQVDILDTAGIQLLLSSVRSFESAGGSITWQGSDILADGFEQLGFAGIYHRHLG